MRKHIVFLLFLSISFASFAQKYTDYGYLFDDFQEGTVIFNYGDTTNSFFNYELISEKMHFKDNNTILQLSNPETVEQITIGKDTFEHIKGSTFYQKINIGNIDLYIKHSGSLIPQGKYTGYGHYSSTTNVANLTVLESVDGRGTNTDLENKIKYGIKKSNRFYLKIKDKFKEFSSINSLAKLFNDHRDEIKKALKEKDLDFDKIDDVIEAIKYCGQF